MSQISCSKVPVLGGNIGENIPTGEYTGEAKKISGGEDLPAKIPTTINLFPMKEEFQQGVGILKFNEASYKFFWETDSVEDTTWDISFVKDNNIYADLNLSFSFTGIIEEKPTESALTGSLVFKLSDAIKDEGDSSFKKYEYSLETFIHNNPEIIASKDAAEGLKAKAGEKLSLICKLSGDKRSDIKIILEKLDDQSKKELNIAQLEVNPDTNENNITVLIPEDLEKSEYMLAVERSGKFLSNSVALTVE